MADQMLFPDTVEEFMEQYKIVDTEQIYTNGAEMVPIFRMKQWFEHKPERKTGKWIIRETAFEDTEAKCSNCGFVTLVNEPENGLHMVSDLLFCQRCGSFNAKMGGEQT